MEAKGFTYGYGARRGDYRSAEGIASQDRLFDTGINYVCLAVAVNQKSYSSTEIFFDYRTTVTDRDIEQFVRRAHDRGIQVCLKPMINCSDGIWRALIQFPDENMFQEAPYWDQWFEFYTAFLVHYAELAEETGCEMFCIGCEMCGTERKEEHWRNTISKVREVYHGPLVYNTNHGKEEQVTWFDALDYLGTSAYYPVAKVPCESAENMEQAWCTVRDRLQPLCERFGKKLIFMEIGCRSASGCACMPWDFNHKEFPVDEEEQARFYDTCLKVFGKESWFAGVFWWDWSTKIYQTKEEAAADTGFNIHLKKAEQVIRDWYAQL